MEFNHIDQISQFFLLGPSLSCVGTKPQLRAEHTFCKSKSALRVGVKTMMHCCPIYLVMMRYPLVDIPPEVPSLADEVVEQNARNHTGRVQEDVRQLP